MKASTEDTASVPHSGNQKKVKGAGRQQAKEKSTEKTLRKRRRPAPWDHIRELTWGRSKAAVLPVVRKALSLPHYYGNSREAEPFLSESLRTSGGAQAMSRRWSCRDIRLSRDREVGEGPVGICSYGYEEGLFHI